MGRPVVAVVDYGAGNLRSVQKAMLRSEMDARITADPDEVRRAEGVVLPGVGAFADAMRELTDAGLVDAMKDALASGTPYLGICFGLQLLFEEGDEHGITKGLGILGGRVERFPDTDSNGAPLCVPHIGWNEVVYRGDHPMLDHLPERDHYYFVHSYRPVPRDESIVVGTTQYGGEFASAVATGSVFAVQFHPEKSQQAGRRMLDAFRSWIQES